MGRSGADDHVAEGVVSPRDIPAADAFTGALGSWESEFVAQSILEVLQREDRWAVLFTRRDIQESGARTLTQLAWCSQGFADLIERGLISPVCGELYCVTQDFAARAAQGDSAPSGTRTTRMRSVDSSPRPS